MSDDDIDQPEKSGEWLDMIADAERYFDDWQMRADNADRMYSDLSRLTMAGRDQEFALFWSNVQVMLPAIYARPPVPVVTPKFSDRDPVKDTASELLERNCIVSFDMDDINQVMLSLRDDLAIVGRGVAWLRYEDDDQERICYEHIDRRDFVHAPARDWRHVDWVARRGWLTRREMRERFGPDIAAAATYHTRPSNSEGMLTGATDHREKCGVWEIWHKPTESVVWVSEGVDEVLDSGEPHLDLECFFPCPEPVYATLQRRSLIPVPDVVYYADQLTEINSLTRRIHALGEALRLRGFYQAGGDIGDAIETAMAQIDDGKIMVPVPAWASLSSGGGDPIIWMPIEQVASTITSCVELRRQLMEDTYQLIGLSDIMRGHVDADEKLGQSQLKQQNGSYRVRDKQQGLVRIARDLARMGAEIMAEKFTQKSLVDYSQMPLPTDAQVKKQVRELEAAAKQQIKALQEQAQEAMAQAEAQQQDPAQIMAQFEQQQQQMLESWGQQIGAAGQAVTIEQVMDVLRDQKLRPYTLDIETDSTIYPDEMAEKSARAEFMQAFSGVVQTIQPLLMAGESGAGLAGGLLKFSLAPFRVGRQMDGLIDKFVEEAPKMLGQQGGNEAEQALAEANQKIAEAELGKAQAAIAKVEADTAKSQMEAQQKAQEFQVKAQQDQQRFALEVEQTQGNLVEQGARIQKIEADIQLAMAKLGIEEHREQREDVKTAMDIQARQTDQAMARRSQLVGEARADRHQAFAERPENNGGV